MREREESYNPTAKIVSFDLSRRTDGRQRKRSGKDADRELPLYNAFIPLLYFMIMFDGIISRGIMFFPDINRVGSD